MGDELCPMQHLGGEAERPQQRRAQASSSSEPIKKRSRKTKLVPPGKLGEHCFNDKNVLRWFQFIAERHRVWKRWLGREQHPWTHDVALLRGRFCNVFRFLDRESLYVITRIILPLCDSAAADTNAVGKIEESRCSAKILFNIVLFRAYVNSGDSMDLLGLQDPETFDPAAFVKRVQEIRIIRGGRFSNAAYNVGSFARFSDTAEGKGCKPLRVAAMMQLLASTLTSVLQSLQQSPSSEYTYNLIASIRGVGKFVAYQIAVDVGYWQPRLYNESKHSYVGPGAKKGLKWLFQNVPKGVSDIALMELLVQRQHKYWGRAGVNAAQLFAGLPFSELNLMAVENCLCEGGKYFRFQELKGKFKQNYRGTTGASDVYLDRLRVAHEHCEFFHRSPVDASSKPGSSLKTNSESTFKTG